MASGLKKAGYLTVAFVSAGAFALVGGGRLYFSRHPHAAPAPVPAEPAPAKQPEAALPAPVRAVPGKDYANLKGLTATTRDGKTVSFNFIAIVDPTPVPAPVFNDGQFEKIAEDAAKAVVARHSLGAFDDNKTLRHAVDAVKRTGGRAQDVTLSLEASPAVAAEIKREMGARGAGGVKCAYMGMQASLSADELRVMAGVRTRSRKP